MKKTKTNYSMYIAVFFIGMIVAFGIVQFSTPNQELAHEEHKHEHTMHEAYEYTGENPPTVELVINKDKKSGYNIEIATTNFKFSPENVNLEHVDNEGHAHLYINGENKDYIQIGII